MDNRSKIDRLHDLIPKHFNSRNNPNWKAIIDAIGSSDQQTADLIEEVRKQFFVRTASHTYLDNLGSNVGVTRPHLVGMDDPAFRQYIPVMSYQPKQVKHIIDKILDLFFFKESTTAFTTSQLSSPFVLNDGWELNYLVDELHYERIIFKNEHFTNISSATADEVVAAINRQTQYSYAVAYYDSILKNTFIRLFSNTIGSKGSLRITGGHANIGLRFDGFIDEAGNGSNTQWTISKIGDEVTMTNIGGANPGLNYVNVGDIILSNLPNNEGSYVITGVDLSNNSIKYTNLLATAGSFTQTSADDVKFMKSQKMAAYLNSRRAMMWETAPGEITVELPVSPIVRRNLKGSIHLNGVMNTMTNRVSDSALTVADATNFPNSGTFIMEAVTEIQTVIDTPTESTVSISKNNNRLIYPVQRYNYTSRTALSTNGNIVAGSNQITNLASTAGLAVGQEVIMEGFPPYTKVTSILGSTATLSQRSNNTGNGVAVSFLGNTLTGITPALPQLATTNSFTISSISRASNIVTVVTSAPNKFEIGETVAITGSNGIDIFSATGDISLGSNVISNISDMSGILIGQMVIGANIPINTYVTGLGVNSITISSAATDTDTAINLDFSENLNGAFTITSIVSPTTFTFDLKGSNGTASVPGFARVEKFGLSNSGSKIIITDSISNSVSRITGSYVWDQGAEFVLSSNMATINSDIQAGKIVRLLEISPNSGISTEGGFVVFDYGLDTQEGPIRYLYRPSDSTIVLDPSYVFQKSHPSGSNVVAILKHGPHQISNNGSEYAPYITDPAEARIVVEELIRSVKSAGIFINFLIRYPEQLYGLFDVYGANNDEQE